MHLVGFGQSRWHFRSSYLLLVCGDCLVLQSMCNMPAMKMLGQSTLLFLRRPRVALLYRETTRLSNLLSERFFLISVMFRRIRSVSLKQSPSSDCERRSGGPLYQKAATDLDEPRQTLRSIRIKQSKVLQAERNTMRFLTVACSRNLPFFSDFLFRRLSPASAGNVSRWSPD